MFDLDAYQQEVDLADDDVLEVIPAFALAMNRATPPCHVLRLVVLELDMQAVLDTDFHLDRVVAVGWHPVRMYP